MSYTHNTSNAYPSVGLHDRRATGLVIYGQRPEFTFDGGFTLTPKTALNPQASCVDTGRAALAFTEAETEFHIHREHRLFRRTVLTTRKKITLKQLAEKLNSGRWELEFIHEYYGYNSAFYNCCIWQRHKPYHIECQLDVYCEDIEYLWDDAPQPTTTGGQE